MKNGILGGALFLLLIAGAAHARVTGVVLYPGSATIERAAAVTAGSGKLEITGLPSGFDLRTLRVEAGPGIRIGEVAVHDVGRAEAVSRREAELESRIESLRDEKAALEVEVKTAELVRNYLASLSTPPREGEKQAAFDPKTIPAVVEAMRRGAGDSYGVIHRATIQKRAIDRQVAALERDLARLKSGARDARTLIVSYSASRAGEVRAAYQVSNAGWRPVYRAALDSATSRVELERQALVMQRTGEDWSAVRVRLSTGQPRAAQVLDPQPWQLVIRPPASAAVAARSMAMEMRDKAAEMPAAAPTQVETQYHTEFDVPGTVDLPADGRQVTVSLARQSILTKQRLRVVPRRDPAAMVTAEAALPEGVWIPGEVQLYRDGSYVGSTFWQAQAKERLVLPFGRDDRVHVAVHRMQNRSGSAGIVGQRAEREIADLYTVTSRHNLPVELLVLEASPVAVSDEIRVEAAFNPQPKLKEWDNRRGVVAWEQSLAPGETLKFAAGYTISYPKDAAIVGLP